MRGFNICLICSFFVLFLSVANGLNEDDIADCETISLRSYHGQYVVAEANGQANANRDNVGKIGRWKLDIVGDGKVTLQGVYGKYLVAEGNGGANANREAALAWERFEPIHLGGNKFALKTHHDTFLVAEQDGSLNANSEEADAWETFEVACLTPDLCAKLYKNHLPTKDDGPSLEVIDAATNDYESTNAPDGWDDEVTSFDVQPDCELTGYENQDKNGHMFSFAAGSYEAPKDNTLSSWICTCDPTPPPTHSAALCAVLYKNHLPSKDEDESLEVFDAAENDYEGTNAPDGWDDEVSSFTVLPGCELTGYENQDKNGHMFSFAAGSYEAPKDDTLSSWICTCS